MGYMACMPRTKTSMGLVVTILETNKDRDYDADAESTGWLTGHHAQPGHHHIIASCCEWCACSDTDPAALRDRMLLPSLQQCKTMKCIGLSTPAELGFRIFPTKEASTKPRAWSTAAKDHVAFRTWSP